jgi:hypothetical protein
MVLSSIKVSVRQAGSLALIRLKGWLTREVSGELSPIVHHRLNVRVYLLRGVVWWKLFPVNQGWQLGASEESRINSPPNRQLHLLTPSGFLGLATEAAFEPCSSMEANAKLTKHLLRSALVKRR